MAVQQSTVFWRSLGIVDQKRARTIKHYKPGSDKSALRRLGISQVAIDDVYAKCLGYTDKLFFKKFSRFFKKDIDTVKVWTKTRTASQAFLELFNIYHVNTAAVAKEKFSELALIFEFYKKGEGQLYSGIYKSSLKIEDFPVIDLLRRLNRYDSKAAYRNKGSAQFGKEFIIWIEKKLENKTTSKFIKLSLDRKQLRVALSMDSKREYYAAKNTLERKFATYLDTPESLKDFDKFKAFLNTGISPHFILSGASYLDSEFRVSLVPSFNRIENVTKLAAYKTKLTHTTKKLEFLTQLRLSYINKSINKPIFISILTYKEGIFGAILIRPDDKRLTAQQRKQLYLDFKTDFNLPLNEFLKYDDLTEKAIYKYFLQTLPTKVSKIELRSTRAMTIYKTLLNDKLVVQGDTTEEVARVCVNSGCREYFKTTWGNNKYCSTCGEILITGRNVEIKKIDESNIVRFLKDSFVGGVVNNNSKKLLSRNIAVSQIAFNGGIADFIPISTPLNENQIEILKLRYPHSVIITTRDDTDYLISKGCQAVALWEIVYSLKHDNANILKQYIRKAKAQSLANMRALCAVSVLRVINDSYYKDRNKEVKNLGAELFEADCSILFDYVFGSCIWLGAKHRGSSLPDGFTAFPMLTTTKGCFIWDGKFSEGKALVMGKFSKNKTYIDDAKANQSIKKNGGLKGFVFISNNIFPASFTKKYLPLTKNRNIKISFIRAIQFKKITEHYQNHEKLILNNSKARLQFSNSMVNLFFTTTKGRKCEIISDTNIDHNITNDETYFKKLTAGKPLQP